MRIAAGGESRPEGLFRGRQAHVESIAARRPEDSAGSYCRQCPHARIRRPLVTALNAAFGARDRAATTAFSRLRRRDRAVLREPHVAGCTPATPNHAASGRSYEYRRRRWPLGPRIRPFPPWRRSPNDRVQAATATVRRFHRRFAPKPRRRFVTSVASCLRSLAKTATTFVAAARRKTLEETTSQPRRPSASTFRPSSIAKSTRAP